MALEVDEKEQGFPLEIGRGPQGVEGAETRCYYGEDLMNR